MNKVCVDWWTSQNGCTTHTSKGGFSLFVLSAPAFHFVFILPDNFSHVEQCHLTLDLSICTMTDLLSHWVEKSVLHERKITQRVFTSENRKNVDVVRQVITRKFRHIQAASITEDTPRLTPLAERQQRPTIFEVQPLDFWRCQFWLEPVVGMLHLKQIWSLPLACRHQGDNLQRNGHSCHHPPAI